MKNKKQISILLITLVITLFSCSKARIEKPINKESTNIQNLIQFVPLDNYFKSKQNIKTENKEWYSYNPSDSTSYGTFITNATLLLFPNGEQLNYPNDYPINCNILKLDCIKDYIYYQKEPFIDSNLLSNIYIMYRFFLSNNS